MSGGDPGPFSPGPSPPSQESPIGGRVQSEAEILEGSDLRQTAWDRPLEWSTTVEPGGVGECAWALEDGGRAGAWGIIETPQGWSYRPAGPIEEHGLCCLAWCGIGLEAAHWVLERRTELRGSALLDGPGRAGGWPRAHEKRGSLGDGQRTGQEWTVRCGRRVDEWTDVRPSGGRLRIPAWRAGSLSLRRGSELQKVVAGGESEALCHEHQIYVVVSGTPKGALRGKFHFFELPEEVWRWLEMWDKVTPGRPERTSVVAHRASGMDG
ncbi:hypothetical protein NDU88_000463 [Pleurodeles waltl]|uniref:Uncharacterized protein n=1 Tax=Pleurodeles waltl TaxID=8319 RepID=A0AAV7VXF9_PLEWA|nr:hypothetical protein NDU88_000463 [Pleurodeles waltl]